MIIVVRPVFQAEYYHEVFLDKYLYKLKMLEYDKIVVSQGIDVNKTNGWHKCAAGHYWYFLNINFSKRF